MRGVYYITYAEHKCEVVIMSLDSLTVKSSLESYVPHASR